MTNWISTDHSHVTRLSGRNGPQNPCKVNGFRLGSRIRRAHTARRFCRINRRQRQKCRINGAPGLGANAGIYLGIMVFVSQLGNECDPRSWRTAMRSSFGKGIETAGGSWGSGAMDLPLQPEDGGRLHRPDQALHLLPRQAPPEGPQRGGGRSVPDDTDDRCGARPRPRTRPCMPYGFCTSRGLARRSDGSTG